jgi:Arc/MetJ-type ribon-helix-helix transcriptional regulator
MMTVAQTAMSDAPSEDELRARIDAVQNELDEFRTRVRERAIQGFRNRNWDLADVNAALEELGLECFEPTYVTRARATIEIRLQANESDSDAARDGMQTLLDRDDVRDDLRAALAQVLAKHESEAITVCDNDGLTVEVGWADQVQVD